MPIALYNILLYLIMPFVLMRLYWRGRRNPSYRQRVMERFGLIPPLAPAPERLWVHAASLGEVVAAAPIIRAWRARFPQQAILVTTTSPTGADEVNRRFGSSVDHRYLPYDMPAMVERFLSRALPSRLLVMETELWPNLYRACRNRGIHIYLVNARLSERSFVYYARFKPMLRRTLACLEGIAARSEEDAQRLLLLGAVPARVRVTGNVKFDMILAPEIVEMARLIRQDLGDRPIWIAGSTHSGEDRQVLEAHSLVLSRFPDALLILAPRHPERFESVARLCLDEDFAIARRGKGERPSSGDSVWLADTLGELTMLYGVADVAFVGGSLVPTGGHNPLEPSAHGVPVISGPHVFNFNDVYTRMERVGGVSRVADAASLGLTVLRLLDSKPARQALSSAAGEVLEKNRGAVTRILEWIVG